MKKKKGRKLEGQLMDSLLQPNQQQAEVRPESVSISSGAPDLDLELAEEKSEVQAQADIDDATNPMFQPAGTEEKTFSIPIPPKDDSPSRITSASSSETTVRLKPPSYSSPVDEPSIRVGFGVMPKVGPMGATDAQLAQSESLRFAQQRITDLEREIERLRKENDELANAGELLRRRADETASQKEQGVRRQTELETILKEEKAIYVSNMASKERELIDLRSKVESLESRLENDFKRIRVRERDLEHRLELMKLENATTVRNKDELILDLKRKIDQLSAEAENYRNKGQDLYKMLDEKQETMRRVVRALRIALSIIEGEDEQVPLKKVD